MMKEVYHIPMRSGCAMWLLLQLKAPAAALPAIPAIAILMAWALALRRQFVRRSEAAMAPALEAMEVPPEVLQATSAVTLVPALEAMEVLEMQV
jgi:hypothetical protein